MARRAVGARFQKIWLIWSRSPIRIAFTIAADRSPQHATLTATARRTAARAAAGRADREAYVAASVVDAIRDDRALMMRVSEIDVSDAHDAVILLDDDPALVGVNTTSEYLAGFLFDRLKARIAAGALGDGVAGALAGMKVTLRESPVAWAAFEGPLG